MRWTVLLAALFGFAALACGPACAAESRYAENGDVRIHYAVSGEGPLVVALHGFPDYHASWDGLRDALGDGYRFAAPDLRGYNLSSRPEGVEHYDMAKLVADIAAIVAAEGRSSATIVGHDWGAAIAWQVVLQRPDLVDRLVILSVPHPATFGRFLVSSEEQQANSQYAQNFKIPGFESNLTAEGLARWVTDEEARAGYVEAFGRSDFTAMLNYYRANYPSPEERERMAGEIDAMPKIAVPVLVIHGMKDTALMSDGHGGMWNHIAADSTLLMIPEAGHFVQHDAADLVERTIVDWLAQRPLDGAKDEE